MPLKCEMRPYAADTGRWKRLEVGWRWRSEEVLVMKMRIGARRAAAAVDNAMMLGGLDQELSLSVLE